MNKVIVISSPYRYACGFCFHHNRAAAKFVCLPTYPDLTTKYTSSNAFMYGSEYYSNIEMTDTLPVLYIPGNND